MTTELISTKLPEKTHRINSNEVNLISDFSTVSASSTLEPLYLGTVKYIYEAYKVINNDFSTCWTEGAENNSGEYIILYADCKQCLNEISIYNGFCASRELFYQNCRVQDCRIKFSDETYLDVTLAGEYADHPNVIELDNAVDTEYMKITILSTYK